MYLSLTNFKCLLINYNYLLSEILIPQNGFLWIDFQLIVIKT